MKRILYVTAITERATTWQQKVFRIFEQASPQPLCAGDVAARLPLERSTIFKAIKSLKDRGSIRPIEGSSRAYVVCGPFPDDRRGKTDGSAQGRKRAPWAAKGLHHGVARQRR